MRFGWCGGGCGRRGEGVGSLMSKGAIVRGWPVGGGILYFRGFWGLGCGVVGGGGGG